MTTLYRQCLLKKENSNLVTWIPLSFATVGRSLKVMFNEEWDSGWIVSEAYDIVDEKNLPDSHDQIKAHRKNTGDSQRKLKNQKAE